MSQVIINFKTDAKLKSEAKEVLDKMGLNFSIAINAYLKRLILEKRIEFTVPEIPNARLRRSIKEAHKMVESGKYTVYKTHEDLEKALFS